MFELPTAEEGGRCSPQVQGAPSPPTNAAVDDDNLGSGSACVPKKRGSSPMLALQWETSRAYAASVSADLGRDAVEDEFARAFIGGCDIIFDRLSRMETHPDSGLSGNRRAGSIQRGS